MYTIARGGEAEPMESNSRNWIRAALAVLAAVLSFAELSVAQTTQKILRVGASWVAPSNQLYAVTTASFLKRMDELGYKSGQGYAFEYVNISQHTQ